MKSIIKNIFEIKNESGFTTNEVSEAERRLDLKLPKVFKNFYSTYAKHPMLNKDFGFEQPNNFKLENSEWLIFYGDVSGVYWWAINKKDFNKKDLPIYINFDGEGYKKETRNFENFLLIRIFEYGYFIFPFRLQCTKLNKIQVEKISETTKKFNTILESENYLKRTMFWNKTDEFICINELRPDNFSVFVFSKKQDSIEKYQELFSQIKWTILPDRTNERNRFDIGLV